MKKGLIAFVGILFSISLTGCGNGTIKSEFEENMSDFILDKSWINEDADYIQYEKLKEDGTLDQDDFYVELMAEKETETSTLSKTEGKIHVTFAQNSNLEVDYYLDANLSIPVDEENCYISPNDFLYGTVSEKNSEYGDLYLFSGYRIAEYDAEGNFVGELKKWEHSGNDNVVLSVPMDFKGTDISVMPIGKYEDCTIILNDYRIKDNSETADLVGSWHVNGKEVTNDVARVNPIDSLSIRYEYDINKFFFVSSNPTSYSHSVYSDSEGEVNFYSATNLSKELNYSVELHPYISAAITSDKKMSGTYEVLDSEKKRKGDTKELDKKKEILFEKLEYGDLIVIKTSEKCRITSDCDRLSEPIEEEINGEYTYSIKVSSEHMPNFQFVLDESVGENVPFAISAEDFDADGFKYIDKAFKSQYLVAEQIVSTKDGIRISVGESTLGQNEAFKFEITKTDKEGIETLDTQYVLSDSTPMEISVLGNNTGTNTYYKNIKVVVSKVEADTYESKLIANATIMLKDPDNGQTITPGSIVDGEREVAVTIKPDKDYYVEGNKNISGDSYIKNMKYSEYVEDISDIVADYPVKKYIKVTLNTTDAYGTCVFKVDGKEKSGQVVFKDSQKLTLEYSISDDNYQIAYDTSGWTGWTNNLKSKTHAEVKINDVVEDIIELDGKTISRKDYLNIKKKGE